MSQVVVFEWALSWSCISLSPSSSIWVQISLELICLPLSRILQHKTSKLRIIRVIQYSWSWGRCCMKWGGCGRDVYSHPGSGGSISREPGNPLYTANTTYTSTSNDVITWRMTWLRTCHVIQDLYERCRRSSICGGSITNDYRWMNFEFATARLCMKPKFSNLAWL
jgi:hypothetical protein